jgi:hypothetical protein
MAFVALPVASVFGGFDFTLEVLMSSSPDWLE